MKFKVGDRVKVVTLKDVINSFDDDYPSEYLNKVGTIIESLDYRYSYYIEFDDSDLNKNKYYWCSDNLELASSKVYTYFVSFVTNLGFYNITLERENKILNTNDIEKVTEEIKDEVESDLVIISINLLS